MNTEITQAHLVIMQELVAFIQERGWAIREIDIRRYPEGEESLEPGEGDWKEKRYKWYLNIETEPRDQDKMPERVKAGLNGS